MAVRALREHDLAPERVREVLSVTLEDEPGALGRYCRRLADAGSRLDSGSSQDDDDRCQARIAVLPGL